MLGRQRLGRGTVDIIDILKGRPRMGRNIVAVNRADKTGAKESKFRHPFHLFQSLIQSAEGISPARVSHANLASPPPSPHRAGGTPPRLRQTLPPAPHLPRWEKDKPA